MPSIRFRVVHRVLLDFKRQPYQPEQFLLILSVLMIRCDGVRCNGMVVGRPSVRFGCLGLVISARILKIEVTLLAASSATISALKGQG